MFPPLNNLSALQNIGNRQPNWGGNPPITGGGYGAPEQPPLPIGLPPHLPNPVQPNPMPIGNPPVRGPFGFGQPLPIGNPPVRGPMGFGQPDMNNLAALQAIRAQLGLA